MKEKNFTIYFVSDSRGRSRHFTLSLGQIRWLGFLVSLVVLGVFTLSLDYFGILHESVENKRLVVENVRLRKNFAKIERKVATLENSIDRVNAFYAKLKMITNVEDRERALNLAIGPLPKPGQNIEGSPYQESLIARRPSSQGENRGETNDHDHLHTHADHGELRKNEVSEVEGQAYTSLAVRIDSAVRESQLREQNILELWETLSERRSLLSATPSIKPARGWMTSRFGYRTDPFTNRIVMHNGLDIAAAPGSPVYAPADGVVTFAGYDEAYGKLVSIDHGYGVTTRFAHNSRIFVNVGQKVKRRDVISAIGNTGRSTGPHLHYEVRVSGIPVDPANYILE